MIIETKRATFNPIKYPLVNVTGDSTKTGVVIDFDAKNQMVETNNVLEVYVAKAAKAASGDKPTLQILILTGDTIETLATVQSSEVFGVADLTEGAVLYKAALPDKCGKLVRVDLKNAVDGKDFTDGVVVGTVRPL